MSLRRLTTWTVCAVGPANVKRFVLVKGGSPRRGHIVFSHPLEIVAQLAMHAGSVGAPDGSRVPQKATLAKQREHLADLARNIMARHAAGAREVHAGEA